MTGRESHRVAHSAEHLAGVVLPRLIARTRFDLASIVVDTLIDEGFSFSTVDDLLGIPAYAQKS